MATIREVAAKAGVSAATVSRVLSGDPGFSVRAETRSKINEAVAQLGYEIPVKRQTRYRFGCVFSDTIDKYSDPFFAEILSAMERACENRNAAIALIRSYPELSNPQTLQEFTGAGLDGVFLMEHVSPEIMTALSTHIPHIIFVDKNEPEYEFDNVGFDHAAANLQVMNALLQRGYRRIGIISGSSPKVPLSESIRMVIYREALRRAGIPFDEALVKDCSWELSICEEQTRQLMALPRPPDAIFAGNDSLASVVLGTLYAEGYRCPRDVGVIGFNNIDLSSHTVPPLTTIDVPTEDIGKASVERMIQVIKDKDSSTRRILFPTKLIERKSLTERKALK